MPSGNSFIKEMSAIVIFCFQLYGLIVITESFYTLMPLGQRQLKEEINVLKMVSFTHIIALFSSEYASIPS